MGKNNEKIAIALAIIVVIITLSYYFEVFPFQKKEMVISKELQACVDRVDYAYDIENKKFDVYLDEKYGIKSDYEVLPAGAGEESYDSMMAITEKWNNGLKDCFKKYPQQ